MYYKCFNATNIAYFATFHTVKNVVSPRAMAMALALAVGFRLSTFDFRLSTFRYVDMSISPYKKNRPEGRFF